MESNWDAIWQSYTRLLRALDGFGDLTFKTRGGRRLARLRLEGKLVDAWKAVRAEDAGIAAAIAPGLNKRLVFKRV